LAIDIHGSKTGHKEEQATGESPAAMQDATMNNTSSNILGTYEECAYTEYGPYVDSNAVHSLAQKPGNTVSSTNVSIVTDMLSFTPDHWHPGLNDCIHVKWSSESINQLYDKKLTSIWFPGKPQIEVVPVSPGVGKFLASAVGSGQWRKKNGHNALTIHKSQTETIKQLAESLLKLPLRSSQHERNDSRNGIDAELSRYNEQSFQSLSTGGHKLHSHTSLLTNKKNTIDNVSFRKVVEYIDTSGKISNSEMNPISNVANNNTIDDTVNRERLKTPVRGGVPTKHERYTATPLTQPHNKKTQVLSSVDSIGTNDTMQLKWNAGPRVIDAALSFVSTSTYSSPS
jgi:hypothetical protein